jgi:predicted RNA-binding Zn-ribbon protein involved in translation (DUF1610 family)
MRPAKQRRRKQATLFERRISAGARRTDGGRPQAARRAWSPTPIGVTSRGRSSMADVDTCRVEFQCPHCGHELGQTIGKLKLQNRLSCPGCHIGINIDANRLSNVVEEIRNAIEKVPSEITIKFYR